MQAVKIFFVIFYLSFSQLAFANLSENNIKKFSALCFEFNSKLDKVKKQCVCEIANFKWLLSDSRFGVFSGLYTMKVTGDKISADLEPLAKVIFDISSECYRRSSYRAFKVRKLMRKK